MRVLLYSWNANNEQILADNFIRFGFEVVWFRKECKHYTRDMELAMELIPLIHAQGAEAVVSFNYFPILSMICNTCQIPYYAWVYDCPHFTLYAKQAALSCNHIGIFDREMVRQMREEYGIGTVYHVPLSVDVAYFDSVITQASEEERQQFWCDISFVGSLYTDAYNYYDRMFGAGDAVQDGESLKGEETEWRNKREKCHAAIADAISRQCFAYHEDYLRQDVRNGRIDLQMIQAQMKKQGLMLGEDYLARSEDILLAAVLEKKATVEERRMLLIQIADRFASNSMHQPDSVIHNRKKEDATEKREQKKDCVVSNSAGKRYDFRLYTGSDTSSLPELSPYDHGTVDYHTQMPLVFAGSRINLNISLRSIRSGIPLRVLDIMACGGFVLSNWQPEITQYFEEGVEIVTFDSLQDCLAKIAYYLTHEEERKQIAARGQRKVQEKFSYQIGLERLFT
ncbi:MAG: glycosyltransferase [Lachnospiraceae bacterium]